MTWQQGRQTRPSEPLADAPAANVIQAKMYALMVLRAGLHHHRHANRLRAECPS